MMKQKAKKLRVMAMTFLLAMSSFGGVAHAANPAPVAALSMNSAMPRWNYLITMMGDLRIEDSGIATVIVYCNSDFRDVTKIKAKCELQRFESSGWKTIKSWTETDDVSSIGYEKHTAVYKDYSYRLRITAYAYNGSTLLEQATEIFDYGYYN